MELEKSAEQLLPGSEGEEGDMVEAGWQGAEMTQTMYAHMNK
jgi:hypothetical protein